MLDSVRLSAIPASLGLVMVKPALVGDNKVSLLAVSHMGWIYLYAEEVKLSETVEQRM